MTKIKDMTKEEIRLYWAAKKMESRLKAAIPDSEEDTIETETSIRLWMDARKAHAEGTRLGRKKRAKPLRPSELRARRLMKAIISDPAHPGFVGPLHNFEVMDEREFHQHV
jgi:hypothetical protein